MNARNGSGRLCSFARSGTLLALLGTVLCVPALAQTTPAAHFTVTRAPWLPEHVVTGDFNNDGRADMVGTPSGEGYPPGLAITFGRLDGTLLPPQPLGVVATAVAAGHVNGDGYLDLIVSSATALSVLPGSGTGTFAPPRLIHAGQHSFTASGQFTPGDTHLDVVLASSDADNAVLIYPGNGDFTFDVPFPASMPSLPSRLRAGDIDGDGLTDLLGIAEFVDVLMLRNTGTMGFEARTVPFNREIADVRAADLNGDGIDDVVVALSQDSIPRPWTPPEPGGLAVLWGGFAATTAEEFDTGLQLERRVAVGDFTGDGQPDIASGNWSVRTDEHFGVQLGSNVAILKGAKTGATTAGMTFGAPVAFPLAPVNTEPYWSASALEAADLNGDGRLDLVHAPGAVLVNRVPAPNSPPTVFAGIDQSLFLDEAYDFPTRAQASDPDGHWLQYLWNTGETVPWVRRQLWEARGPVTLTVTVDDGQGGVATDSVTYTVLDRNTPPAEFLSPSFVQAGRPYTIEWSVYDLEDPVAFTSFSWSFSTDGGRTFQPITECLNRPGTARSCVWQNPGPASTAALLRMDAAYGASAHWVRISEPFVITATVPLPAGWESRDIGSVGVPGSAAQSGAVLAVRGAGADIWGTADAFHFAYTPVRGDFDVTTQVSSVEAVNQWTKAGLMIRNGIGAGAAHVSLFATPSRIKGLSLQSRGQDGGSSSEAARVAVEPEVYIRLQRRGNTVHAAWRKAAGDPWLALPAVAATLTETVLVGVAVSSHVRGEAASAAFYATTIVPQMSGLPPGVVSGDIGAVGAPGRTTYDGTTYTVAGSGADIWGTADELQFVSTHIPEDQEADFELTARVTGVQNVNAWTKAGIMVRAHNGAGAAHASLFVTPSTVKGIAFQRRRSDGASSVHTSAAPLTAPVWLKLTVRDGLVRAYYRTETGPWTFVAEDHVALGATQEAGLAVSSHVDGRLATATFEHVSIRPIARSWNDADIGAVGVAGTTAGDDVTVRLEGSGADIWGTADAFRIRSTDAFGRLSRIAARVLSLENTNAWAKAGVMIRETASPSSPYVMLVVSASRGVAMQYRALAGGPSANVVVLPGTAPRWVRLGRRDATFIGEVSADGRSWTEAGRITVAMNDSSLGALAVTSHANATLATAVFDDVVIDMTP